MTLTRTPITTSVALLSLMNLPFARPSSTALASGRPIAFTLRAGVSAATSYDWQWRTEVDASPLLASIGPSIEFHRVHGFVIGTGCDIATQKWSVRDDSEESRPPDPSLRSLFVYGTVGRCVWNSRDNGLTSWIAADLGQFWSGHNNLDYTGASIRLRASWMRTVYGSVAVGVDAGWQWAEPQMQRDAWNGYGPVPRDLPRMNLSGPLLAARISLVSTLGRR